RQGWMSPFAILGLLSGLALAWLIWMLPRDPAVDPSAPGIWLNFQHIWRSPPALAGLAVGLLATAANEVVNLVFGVWMEQGFGLQIAALGGSAAVIGLAELGGESLVGALVDRLGKKRAIGIGLAANGLAALALPLLGRNIPGALAGLFLFYLTFEFTLVSTIPLMTELLPAARATLMAMNVSSLSLGRALGALVAAPLYQGSILFCALAALVFNLLALLALRTIRVQA
ncbi:MAG: MFS transporter, partial [Anaerolineales bacterium]|nr:MFS transporter [Anaerolineales bacterium]